METDPFKRSSSEASAEHKDDDSEDSASKKKKKARRLPLLAAQKDAAAEKKDSTDDKAETIEDAALLWRKLISQTTGTSGEKTAEETKDAAVETAETSELPEQSLETLSPEERAAVTAEYVRARRAELAAQLEGQDSEVNDPVAAEQAADLVLLEEMQRMLERDDRSRQPGNEAEPLQDAYESTARRLAALQEAGGEPRAARELISNKEPDAGVTSTLFPHLGRGGGTPGGPDNPRRPYDSGNLGANGGNVIFSRPAVAAETASVATAEAIDSAPNRTGSALLLGGVVGYLIGRRRGRIKTEKRLKTVEKKLSAEVDSAHQQVAEKERQIRHLARETYERTKRRLSYESPVAAFTERPGVNRTESGPQARRDERLGLGVVTLRAAEATPVIPGRMEQTSNMKPFKNETNTAHERLSKNMQPERDVPKSSQMMDRVELLQAAGEVRVGATNLRRVYETNLISEQGLRRLIAAHEHGGNVREILEQEIIERELSFERDPRLRNHSRSLVGSLASGAVVRAEIDEPLGKNTAGKNGDAAAGQTKKEDKEGPETSIPQPSQTAVVTAGIIMFVVLAVLLYLLLTGRSL